MNPRLVLQPGVVVTARGRTYRISQVLDLETLLAIDTETGKTSHLPISELTPAAFEDTLTDSQASPDLATVAPEDWQIAEQRYATLLPILEAPRWTSELIHRQATSAKVHPVTIYRWLKQYQRNGRVSALIPAKPGAEPGRSRLPAEVDAIVQATIDEVYLNKQKPSVQRLCNEISRRCRNAGLKPPHPNTVRYRIHQLSDKEKTRRREGGKAVHDRYAPVRDPFPGADWPLAIVQVDHTLVDIILVDDLDRQPVGRPWITLAIDVFSRVVAGFYISFDPPGAMSVGLCLAHAILPKETGLAKHKIATPWPLWGVMNAVHADNAKEFRGSMLRRACAEYGIDLHWRPVAQPHYGGHIERLCGTLNEAIHALPGTTFSNTQQRGAYRSEDQAVFTLSEFETWLTVQIVEVYHQQVHSGLGLPPVKQYEQGIFGNDKHPGRGLPDRLLDETRLRLDLMPYEERTVQPYGIVIDEIQYFSDSLRPWIHAKDPGDAKHKRKFIVRRDPRDISVVYFYDPELDEYFEIPYRDTSHPSMSVWELREVRRRLREEGHQAVNEALIFEAYNRLRAMEEEAIHETKKARRTAQRRRQHAQREPLQISPAPGGKDFPVGNLDDITPFDEIIELDD